MRTDMYRFEDSSMTIFELAHDGADCTPGTCEWTVMSGRNEGDGFHVAEPDHSAWLLQRASDALKGG